MELAQPSKAEWAAQQFDVSGSLESVSPHGRGHIHDTYVAAYLTAGQTIRCLIQRVNTGVFKEPARLMENIQRVTAHIEQKMGRYSRTGEPRIIDIDILLYGDKVVDLPNLKIPHPKMTDRSFVLVPLSEIAPDAVHPVEKKTVKQMNKAIKEKQGVFKLEEQ